jgi:hypothetical protein
VKWPLVLYHGTTVDRLPTIIEKGIETSEGWAGAATEGVYMSTHDDSAIFWAKWRLMRDLEWNKIEESRFDRILGERGLRALVVLEVRIPKEAQGRLRADMEQAEDFQFEGEPEDWERALTENGGELMFEGPVPPEWIVVPKALRDPSEVKARIAELKMLRKWDDDRRADLETPRLTNSNSWRAGLGFELPGPDDYENWIRRTERGQRAIDNVLGIYPWLSPAERVRREKRRALWKGWDYFHEHPEEFRFGSRANPDEDLRRLERAFAASRAAEDEARLMTALVRSGRVREDHLRFLAEVGDEAAQLATNYVGSVAFLPYPVDHMMLTGLVAFSTLLAKGNMTQLREADSYSGQHLRRVLDAINGSLATGNWWIRRDWNALASENVGSDAELAASAFELSSVRRALAVGDLMERVILRHGPPYGDPRLETTREMLETSLSRWVKPYVMAGSPAQWDTGWSW